MKKVISFVLWGDKPIYNDGIIANVEMAPRFYPGWTVRVMCGDDAPAYKQLLTMDCEVVLFEPVKTGVWTNLFRRFLPCTDPTVDVCVFRDADSRLNWREVGAVNEWLASGKALHVMHDNIFHYRLAMCSGMWGVLGGWLPRIDQMSRCWLEAKAGTDFDNKDSAVDEAFLDQVVWPMFKYGNYIGHGIHERIEREPYGDNEHPFPPHEPLEYGTFVGQVIQPVQPAKTPAKLFRFRRS